MPARRPIPRADGLAALGNVRASSATGQPPARTDERVAVRWLLEELGRRAPGASVEIRVPPYAAIQAVAGPRHTRGTPPAVVEMSPTVWLGLATGTLAWAAALAEGSVLASGDRADLSAYLPIVDVTSADELGSPVA